MTWVLVVVGLLIGAGIGWTAASLLRRRSGTAPAPASPEGQSEKKVPAPEANVSPPQSVEPVSDKIEPPSEGPEPQAPRPDQPDSTSEGPDQPDSEPGRDEGSEAQADKDEGSGKPAADPADSPAHGAATSDTATGDDSATEAAWQLEQLRLRLALARQAEVSTAPAYGVATPLAALLEEEVERIREEVGTPGALRWELGGHITQADSLLAYSAIRILLDVLNRRMQAYDLEVGGEPGEDIHLRVICHELDPAVPEWPIAQLAGILQDHGGRLVRAADDYIVELSRP